MWYASLYLMYYNLLMFKIRSLALEDYERIRQVDKLTQIQYLGEEWDKLSEDEKETHLKSRKSEFSLNVETGYCFVATENSEIIGFILAHETLPFHGTLYIRHIAIKPDYQGKGIGPLLYKQLIRRAKMGNIKKVVSMINLDNPKSINLHQKLGFNLKDRKEAVLII